MISWRYPTLIHRHMSILEQIMYKSEQK